jgi:uncharacterized protein YkwD
LVSSLAGLFFACSSTEEGGFEAWQTGGAAGSGAHGGGHAGDESGAGGAVTAGGTAGTGGAGGAGPSGGFGGAAAGQGGAGEGGDAGAGAAGTGVGGTGTAGTGTGGTGTGGTGTGGTGTGGTGTGGTGTGGTGTGETGYNVGMTDAHNAVRAEVFVKALTWSVSLAEYAQQWADTLAQDCSFSHRPSNPYGENLAMRGSSKSFPVSTPANVVSAWAAEKDCWTYGTFMGTDSCNSTCVQALNSSGCGHYTQIVWSTTTSVGCGRSTCTKSNLYYEIWVCNYDPKGNYTGQYPYPV